MTLISASSSSLDGSSEITGSSPSPKSVEVTNRDYFLANLTSLVFDLFKVIRLRFPDLQS